MKRLIALLLAGLLTGSLQFSPPVQAEPATHDHAAAQQTKQDIIDWFWERSDVAFHEGDYPRAIGLHKAIVALDPHDVESYSVAAWLMWSLGNGDEAQQHIERGIKANPDNWEMWDAAGQQDDVQKYFSKAQDAYTHAVQLIPSKEDSRMLRRRLAHAAEHAGDYKTSIATWEKLVNDYPDDAVNAQNLQRVIKAQSAAKQNATQL